MGNKEQLQKVQKIAKEIKAEALKKGKKIAHPKAVAMAWEQLKEK